jgi:prevent-host-death family protein
MNPSSVPVSKARHDMKDIVNRVAYRKERIYLTSHDKKMVAVVPLEDIEALEAMEDAQDLLIAKERIAKSEAEGTFTTQELRSRLGL